MLSSAQLELLAACYEAQMYSKDTVDSMRAALVLKSECRKIQAEDGNEAAKKMPIGQYIALFVTPEILAFLKQRQSKFPTVQPEQQPRKE